MPLPNYRLPTPQEREKWKHFFDTIIDPNLVYIFEAKFEDSCISGKKRFEIHTKEIKQTPSGK
jgi:hypothetical protein